MSEKNITQESNDLWEQIKDIKLNMYALPNQILSAYAERVPLSNRDGIYLKLVKSNATALVPALEQALGREFTVEAADPYIIVKRIVKL